MWCRFSKHSPLPSFIYFLLISFSFLVLGKDPEPVPFQGSVLSMNYSPHLGMFFKFKCMSVFSCLEFLRSLLKLCWLLGYLTTDGSFWKLLEATTVNKAWQITTLSHSSASSDCRLILISVISVVVSLCGYSTCPPLVVEMILVVPPHCFTYHRNHKAETSWVSAVTHRFTKRVASCFADLFRKKQEYDSQMQNRAFWKV